MELFIFIAFLLLTEVQSYKSPAVKVSPDVISESSSVKITCETPADVTVKQCHFYRNRIKDKNIKVSPSCELNLTGAKVLRWADVKSPASVNITCFYTIQEDGIDKASSDSPDVTVVLGSLQKPSISYNGDDVQPVISCEIPSSVRVYVTCRLYTEDNLLNTRVSQKSQSGGQHCMFYFSHSNKGSVNLNCDYSLNTEPEIRSPRSDTITIRESPALKASPDVISESSSVKITCETPADVTVQQCFFYRNRIKDKNIKVLQSCELDLTGAKVLRWADVKSPASVNITCFYTIHEDGIDKASSDAPDVTVTVLGSLQKPSISYNGDDVQHVISCEIPSSVRDNVTCRLYTEDDLMNTRVSQKSQSGDLHYCLFYFSHGELLTGSVNHLNCDYSLKTEPEIRSPRSDTIIIRGPPQANLTASASVINETDTVQLSCEKTEHLEKCYFNITGKESILMSSSCQISLTGSQISVWSEGQSSSVNITCSYTMKKSQVPVPSPHSDPVTVRVQKPDAYVTTAKETTFPTPATPATTAHVTTTVMTRLFSMSNLPTITIKRTTYTLFIALVSTAVGAILTGLICLCCLTCNNRSRKNNKMKSIASDAPSQGTGKSSGAAETYSLITSVPASSQPVSVGVLVNKHPKEGNSEENEVYHMYSTIPDKPVQSNAADHIYSLV